MKLAFIGDIHANLAALDAVLGHIRRQDIRAIWNVGDSVGYGPHPNETLARLRKAKIPSLLGNVDRKAISLDPDAAPPRSRDIKSLKLSAFQWAARKLTPASRRHLARLPGTLRFERGGLRFLLAHGTPDSPAEYLCADTPVKRLAGLAASCKADLVICGHAHQPWARLYRGVWFINTGSVGRPDDGDPRAAYAVVNLARGRTSVRHHRVKYDVRATAQALARLKLPGVFARMFEQGLELEALPGAPGSNTRAGRVSEARELASALTKDGEHAGQVAMLALALFDGLRPLHKLGKEEREWLECAAWLHDVGWSRGGRKHHKASLEIVLETPELAYGDRFRRVVAAIARYHRRALPSLRHRHFRELRQTERKRVTALAALLRVADGLDRSHKKAICGLTCRIEPARVRVCCRTVGNAAADLHAGLLKSDLFRKIFKRNLILS